MYITIVPFSFHRHYLFVDKKNTLILLVFETSLDKATNRMGWVNWP